MSKDWYARRLGVQPQQQQPQQPPAAPVFQQPPAPQGQQWQQPQQPQAPEGEYAPKGASHLRQANDGLCPECGGSEYHGFQGAKPRCYECGYPVVQSGSGISSTQASGPAQPAIQLNPTGASNFNPQGIIGRIG